MISGCFPSHFIGLSSVTVSSYAHLRFRIRNRSQQWQQKGREGGTCITTARDTGHAYPRQQNPVASDGAATGPTGSLNLPPGTHVPLNASPVHGGDTTPAVGRFPRLTLTPRAARVRPPASSPQPGGAPPPRTVARNATDPTLSSVYLPAPSPSPKPRHRGRGTERKAAADLRLTLASPSPTRKNPIATPRLIKRAPDRTTIRDRNGRTLRSRCRCRRRH